MDSDHDKFQRPDENQKNPYFMNVDTSHYTSARSDDKNLMIPCRTAFSRLVLPLSELASHAADIPPSDDYSFLFILGHLLCLHSFIR